MELQPPQPARHGRLLVLTLGALLAFLSFAGAAHAHAELASAQPAPDSQIDEAPTQLVLSFTEHLEDEYTNVEMIGPDEEDHVTGFTIDPDTRDEITAELSPLDDGVYTVRWQALSAADGHRTSGAYLLGVNASLAGQEEAVAGVGDDDDAAPLEVAGRTLGFLGMGLAVGAPLFVFLTQGLELPGTARLKLTGLAAGGAGLGTVGWLLLAQHTAMVTGIGLGAVFGTQIGKTILLRIGLLVVAGGLFALALVPRWKQHAPWSMSAGVLVSSGALLATSFGSHAAARSEDLALFVIADWLHLFAASFWFAGLVGFMLVTRSNPEPGGVAALVRRFSPLAVVSVVVIVLTGIVGSLDRLTQVSDLVQTGFGWALTVKIVLLVPLLALGAYHRYVVLPQAEGARSGYQAVGSLRRTVAVEAGVMVAVMLAAGFLTSMAPPTMVADEPGEEEQVFVFEEEGVRGEVRLEPVPFRVGHQDLWVDLEPVGEDAPDVEEIRLIFTVVSSQGDEEVLQGHDLGEGSWHQGGILFTQAGTWELRVTLQGPVFIEEIFEVEVEPPR